MATLSTQPYKGTRDFYPEDMRMQNYIFKIWRAVAERYGYEEYMAPMIEMTELYRAKTGEEIVNEQSYTFTDRGGREVTIRPELTPSLARIVAARQQELAYPLRWYSIANNWRYERPQRGRLREFWQANLDLLGVNGVVAEVEIIKTASAIMKAFRATDDMYKIRINSRKLLSLLMGDYLSLDVEDAHRLGKLIDRKDKMPEAAFITQAKPIVGDDVSKLIDLLNIRKLDNLPAEVVESGLVEDLRILFEQLEANDVKNYVFDLTLMRGLDYYTDIVFEIFDESPDNKRSLFGGGRYDELTTIFDKPAVPAVGYAIGDVGIYNFLETHNLLPAFPSTTDTYVIVIGEYQKQAQSLAANLRRSGINVAVDITGRKVEAQLKTAVKQDVRYAIFVGAEEAKSQNYTFRNLNAEAEEKLSEERIISSIKK